MVMLPAIAAALLLQSAAATPLPDSTALRHANGVVAPTVRAVRVARGPTVDGRLDEEQWRSAPVLSELVQSDPDEGKPVSESTEVRLIYTEDALYVGARLYDREPGRIASQLGRRDAFTQSDDFRVLLDSYHDHRTAFRFDVTPAGVRKDMVFGDDGRFSDNSWDPVWEAATSVDSLGWTAELRIPFSQLRFSGAQEQVWGVRFVRWIQRKNEFSFFPFVGKTESGFSSRFAHLLGIAGIPAPRRLEVLPYTVARGTSPATSVHGSPFSGEAEYFGGAGLDLKYGLASNLTLDATANPDFGQVDLDPAFVNLTAFEQFLPERRPFFVEGASIFRFGGGAGFISFGGTPQVFYSRRIDELVGAAKLSGRSGPWSLGILDAVTTEPLTNHFVGRAKRELRGGATGFGLMGTAVNRDLDAGTFLRRSAYLTGADFFHRWARNTYSLNGSVSYARVSGDRPAILAAQNFPSRYYGRPDAGHVDVDTTLTQLDGVSADFVVSKDGGSVNWAAGFSTTTPGYEVNDLGFQTRVDRLSFAAFMGRQWTRPGKTVRYKNVSFFWGPSWNLDGDLIQNSLSASTFAQFITWWGASLFAGFQGPAMDDRLTRGGPLTARPASWNAGANLFTDNRKRVQLSLFGNYSRNAAGGWSVNLGPSFDISPSSAVTIGFYPFYFGGRGAAQFVRRVSDPTATDTYGSRYVFAVIDQRQLDLTTRVNLTMSPDLSLQFYVQPFVFAADYSHFRELERPGTFEFLEYGRDGSSTTRATLFDADGRAAEFEFDPDGGGAIPAFTVRNPDFRTQSFQLKGVLRWEYRPGSTLFFVWTHSRGGFTPFDPRFDAGREMGDLLLFRVGRPTNVLQVKANYWLSL